LETRAVKQNPGAHSKFVSHSEIGPKVFVRMGQLPWQEKYVDARKTCRRSVYLFIL
jgi:hypothetical protein